MNFKKLPLIFFILLITSCVSKEPATKSIGRFNINKDLFLANFDCKTDVDDIHSVAAVATMLFDSRFSNVNYHAVAGAYGTQEGLYVPGNELFETSFGNNWSDTHTDRDRALKEVSALLTKTLEKGGNIWIAEAGQSDFTSDVVRNINNILPSIQTKARIHVVQHSDWNESSAAPENLDYVKANVTYHKIPDGNVVGNGSPGFKTDDNFALKNSISQQKLNHIWDLAIQIANNFNGKENRYLNEAIANGGLDFSDVSETCYIFGFDHLVDATQFFKEFTGKSAQKE